MVWGATCWGQTDGNIKLMLHWSLIKMCSLSFFLTSVYSLTPLYMSVYVLEERVLLLCILNMTRFNHISVHFYSGYTQCLEVNVNIGTLLTVQIKTRWCYAGIMCSLLKTIKYFTMLTLLTRTEDKVHLRLIYPSSYQEGDVNVYVLIIPWNRCGEHKNS